MELEQQPGALEAVQAAQRLFVMMPGKQQDMTGIRAAEFGLARGIVRVFLRTVEQADGFESHDWVPSVPLPPRPDTVDSGAWCNYSIQERGQ